MLFIIWNLIGAALFVAVLVIAIRNMAFETEIKRERKTLTAKILHILQGLIH